MYNDDLAKLFLPENIGRGTQLLMGATMTAWDATTYANTVSMVGVTYTDLPVIDAPSMSTGPVVLLMTAAGPIVLGRLYKKS